MSCEAKKKNNSRNLVLKNTHNLQHKFNNSENTDNEQTIDLSGIVPFLDVYIHQNF